MIMWIPHRISCRIHMIMAGRGGDGTFRVKRHRRLTREVGGVRVKRTSTADADQAGAVHVDGAPLGGGCDPARRTLYPNRRKRRQKVISVPNTLLG
jgi:hypothetical protein